MTNDDVRKQLARVLNWEDSHVGFDKSFADVPAHMRGTVPPGLPYSLWQLLEHVRIAQHDILDFCRNPHYQEIKWPDAFWPAKPEPPDAAAWDTSLQHYREDRTAMQQLAQDPSVDLAAPIPHGKGQTCLREIVLVADHTAYHLGEVVLIRRLLGIWKSH